MQRIKILSLLLICLSIAACNTGEEPNTSPIPQDTTPPPVETALRAGDDVSDANGNEEQPVEGMFRDRMSLESDIQGVVTNVVGNEVTLKLIEPLGGMTFEFDPSQLPEGMEIPEGVELPEDGAFFGGGAMAGDGEIRQNFREMDEAELAALRDRAAQNGGQMREGNRQGGVQGAGQGRTTRAAGTETELEVTYTGDEMSVIIPVGIDITAQKKQILLIWTDEDGNITNVRQMGKASN